MTIARSIFNHWLGISLFFSTEALWIMFLCRVFSCAKVLFDLKKNILKIYISQKLSLILAGYLRSVRARINKDT